MDLYLAGNEEAFDELFHRYRARVYGYLFKKVKDPRSVEDLFQATFLNLHRSREHYQKGRLFSAWLFTICRNAVIDFRRKESRGVQITDQDPNDLTIPIETSDPKSDNLKEVLSLVSEKQRELLKYRYEEELEFEEIAASMNTTAANVRQMISRTIRKIKKAVQK